MKIVSFEKNQSGAKLCEKKFLFFLFKICLVKKSFLAQNKPLNIDSFDGVFFFLST
jgi:hypothetical protein